MLKQYRVHILAAVALIGIIAAYLVGDTTIAQTTSAVVNVAQNGL